MTDSYDDFQNRVSRIYKKREKRSFFRKNTRAVYSVNQDGYTVIRGAKYRKPIPWTGLIFVLAAFFGVKGTIISQVGPDIFQSQIANGESAGWVEKAGAWTMQPDPISDWVAKKIKSFS
ncbi:hypothetical protein SAMN05444000_10786 [Shimia gijangensis]|uniref:Uncharacterized protein n=2 Tax=Shimia gijangensis TaxID=1470563 RepID=A0A1M6IE69_9RHOB|nr:hypothetical protein SAMN05444000_10786 [Shimia gijangensis]